MQRSWALWAASWRHFGASRAREGAFWSVCEAAGDVIDAPWAPSGRVWRPLGGASIPTVGFYGGGFSAVTRGPLGGLPFEARGSLILNGFCAQCRWIRGCFFTDFS